MKEHERELIPRKTLFGNPERTAVTISHDGTRIAYLAPLDGVLNVWVAPLEALERASPVTRAQGRGIRRYFWAYQPRFILYLQDRDGDENWHLFAADVETGTARDLTPYDGVQAVPQERSDKFPEEVLIRLNRRDPSVHDLYRVNILTGAAHLVARNDIGADRFVTDRNFNPRLAVVIPPDGGTQVLALSKSGRWEPFMTIGAEDSLTTQPLCSTPTATPCTCWTAAGGTRRPSWQWTWRPRPSGNWPGTRAPCRWWWRRPPQSGRPPCCRAASRLPGAAWPG